MMKKTIFFMVLLYTNLTSFGQDKNQYKSFEPSSKILILNYHDFGPQALCAELIGNEWWQWNTHGDSNPKTKYDIRVIVFKGISLKKVKKQYPVNENHEIDFRYVSYRKAIKYLDNVVEEINAIEELKEYMDVKHYSDLKEKIISHFKSKK